MVDAIGKQRVFIGSSTEGKQIAQTVIDRLVAHGLSAMPWFDFFQNKRPPLQELEQLTLQVDGAILVATPDDQVIVRDRQWHQARDNVLFEYGLFAGAIGRAKCGLLIPDLATFRIPSDFLGVACCEYFRMGSPADAAERVAQSLAATIAKPARPEDVLTRGRRLLSLLGWVRDEAFWLARDWDSRCSRDLVVNRIVAVSAFVQNDIDSLSLRREYDEVERLLLAAVADFPESIYGPGILSPSGHHRMEHGIRALVVGRTRADEAMLDALLYCMDEEDMPSRWADRYSRCHDHLCAWREDWGRYVFKHKRVDGPWSCNRLICGPMAWAIGVAEATAMFKERFRDLYPLKPLKCWFDQNVPRLNDAILTFEKRLHEVLFGPL